MGNRQKTSSARRRPVAVHHTAAGNERVKCLTTQSTITLTPDVQLAFWRTITARPKITAAQKKLGRLMRGEKLVNPPC